VRTLTLPTDGRGTARVAEDRPEADDAPVNVVTLIATAPPPPTKVRCECTYCGAHAHVHPSQALGGRCQNCGCHLLRPLKALDHTEPAGLPLPATGGDDVTEDQARRVAGELHDGAMQEITLARLQLDLISSGIEDQALAEELIALSDALQEASVRLQSLMRGLLTKPAIV
jgi:hypothetical protein